MKTYATPIQKNYGFLNTAAQTLNQGVEQIAAIEDYETKRKREEEELKQLKLDVDTINKARDARIVEAASEYMEAAGLPNDEAGRNRAFAVASSTYYPLTGSERKDPAGAAVRINNLDQTWSKVLARAKMDRYRKETEGYTMKVLAPTLQQGGPQGSVGVEDSGVQRTTAWPQSKQEMVTQANEQALAAPPTFQSVNTAPSAQERYDIARNIDPTLLQDPTVREDIGQTGKQELMDGEYPAGTTSTLVTREALKKPVVTGEMGTYAATFPKPKDPLTELELAQLAKLKAETSKLRKAAETGGSDAVKVSDLTGLQKQRNDISKTINEINNKLLDPRKMDTNNGETVESLTARRDDLEAQLPQIDGDISVIRKRLEIPAVEPKKGAEAERIAKDIRAGVARLVPRKYTVGSNLGRETFIDKKGNARDDLYDGAIAMQVVQFAKQRGFNIPVDAAAKELKNSKLEDIIDYIMQQSGTAQPQ